MIYSARKLFVVFLLSFSFVTCIEEIDLVPEAGQEQSIAIHGRLTKGVTNNDPSEVRVAISNVFSFDASSRRNVAVRTVKLIDQDGNSIEVPEVSTGIYITRLTSSTPVQAVLGNSYILEIATFNNKVYRSEAEFLNEVPSVGELRYDLTQQEVVDKEGEPVLRDKLTYYITPNVNQENGDVGLLWEFERTYRATDNPGNRCYLTDRPNAPRSFIFDPADFADADVGEIELLTLDRDARFAEGNLLTVTQSSLSRGGLEYYNNINVLLEKDGNMFDVPAATIGSNFSNVEDPDDRVYGYFFATQTKFSRVQIKEDEVPNLRKTCPPISPPAPGGCDVCCSCLQFPNSSLIPPPFWKD